MVQARRLISHCARRQQRSEKKWRSSRAFMVTTILEYLGGIRKDERASSENTDSLLPALSQADLHQPLVRMTGVIHGLDKNRAGLGRGSNMRRNDEAHPSSPKRT